MALNTPPCTNKPQNQCWGRNGCWPCNHAADSFIGGSLSECDSYYTIVSNQLCFEPTIVCLQGHFPEAQHDPVIQIATMVSETGKPEPVVRNVMTLDTCATIVGSQVMSFQTERELLLRQDPQSLALSP
eukprot:scaffold163628_cov19-Prasinocladus_malaysianus.AAC.2